MEIALTFKRKDFEELYFINGRGSYVKDEGTKSSFRNLLIAGFVLLGLCIYSVVNNNYDLFAFTLVIFAIFLFVYVDRAMAVRKWRRQIKEYLDSQEKYESHQIVVTDEYFSIIQDNEETIEKWSNFKRVKIFDSHIWLLGTENFIIPAKSMSPLEFNNLKRLVSTKFK